MARMIPPDGPSLTESRAEEDLYAIFKEQLSSDFVVIHSVPWLTDVAGRRSAVEAPTGEVDFLILHPHHGILAVEVKGGSHGVRDHHYVHLKSGRRVPVIKQTRDNAHGLSRWFDPSLGIQGRIGYAIAFPDTSLDRTKLPPALRGGHMGSSDDIVLLMDDLARVGERVLRIMEQWRIRLSNPEPLGQAMVDHIVELVSPRVEGASIWRARVYGRDERWLRLTDQQLDCLGYISRSKRQIVLGWPGTGKTLLAMETVKRMAHSGQRCLFLTFNKLIASHIRTQLEEAESCEAYHFHGLLREMPAAETETADGQEVEANLRPAVREGFFARWDVLVVDEAQALAESWHQALAEAFVGKPVYVFCDDAQRFGFEKGALSSALSDVYGAPQPFHLTYCLRNPYQIHAVLQRMMPPPFQLVCPRAREMTSLEEVVSKSIDEEVANQLDMLLTRGVEPEDIVVLYPYSPPTFVSKMRSIERFSGIASSNVAAFRGMESRVVVFVVDGELDSDVPIFAAYSRATSHCVSIYGFRVLRQALSWPDRARSKHVLQVAREFSDTVRRISDEVMEAHQLGIVEGAYKLNIGTADVYWHPVLRCWLVALRDDEPEGCFWEDQLLQYKWSVVLLKRGEHSPFMYEGNCSLARRTGGCSQLFISDCEICEATTHHTASSGCLVCAASHVDEVPESLIDQLEAYDQQIGDIVARRLRVDGAGGLPVSLVAMGMMRLVAKKLGEYPRGLLVSTGTVGYNAAGTILGAYIVLTGCAEVDRQAFADRFFRYAEACPASPTFAQWWSGVALAFDVAVRQGTLTKTPRKGVYRVST